MTSASTASRRQRSRAGPSHESPEWVELARLIGIDESEIDHWLSQNLQYPAGRVISAWCNYASPPPTVAELYTLVSSKELNRPDLARYIETMYIIEWSLSDSERKSNTDRQRKTNPLSYAFRMKQLYVKTLEIFSSRISMVNFRWLGEELTAGSEGWRRWLANRRLSPGKRIHIWLRIPATNTWMIT